MKTYIVKRRETSVFSERVEAESEEEAKEMAGQDCSFLEDFDSEILEIFLEDSGDK